MRHIFSRLIIGFFSAALLLSNGVVAAPAPDFSLKTEDGKTVTLSDYKGKALILHFWATWCPYCKKLQPGLDALYLKYKSQGLEMLAVSLWEDEGATPQAVLSKRGWHFKTVINGEKVGKLYQAKGTPTTVFIDRKGEIVLVSGNSDPNSPLLEKTVRKIL